MAQPVRAAWDHVIDLHGRRAAKDRQLRLAPLAGHLITGSVPHVRAAAVAGPPGAPGLPLCSACSPRRDLGPGAGHRLRRSPRCSELSTLTWSLMPPGRRPGRRWGGPPFASTRRWNGRRIGSEPAMTRGSARPPWRQPGPAADRAVRPVRTWLEGNAVPAGRRARPDVLKGPTADRVPAGLQPVRPPVAVRLPGDTVTQLIVRGALGWRWIVRVRPDADRGRGPDGHGYSATGRPMIDLGRPPASRDAWSLPEDNRRPNALADGSRPRWTRQRTSR